MSISLILHIHVYIQTPCNDRRNPFHFACRQWYSYNNPGKLTRIQIQIIKFVQVLVYL